MTITNAGVEYTLKSQVSENSVVSDFNEYISNESRHSTTVTNVFKEGINTIKSSELLDSLA